MLLLTEFEALAADVAAVAWSEEEAGDEEDDEDFWLHVFPKKETLPLVFFTVGEESKKKKGGARNLMETVWTGLLSRRRHRPLGNERSASAHVPTSLKER